MHRITDNRPGLWTRVLSSQYLVLGLCVLWFVVVLPIRPAIVSPMNLENLLLSMLLLLVLALGQSFVLLTAGIDLSIPAVISLTSVLGASIMVSDHSPLAGHTLAIALAVAVMLLVGLLIGLFHGLAVALLAMPPFLVTLASLMFASGLAVWFTHSDRIAVPQPFTQIWYGRWLGLPYPVFIVGGLVALAHGVLTSTIHGRRIYAIGLGRRTSSVSGIPVARTLVMAYMASGACAAVGGILYTARLYTGSPQMGQTEILLDCIGAAVIGGVSLFGGKGRMMGLVFGVLFVTLVGNTLNMLGLRYWHVLMVKGAVILLAALTDAVRARYLESP